MCDVVFITPNFADDLHRESSGTLLLMTILNNNGVNCELLQFFKIGDISDFESFLDSTVKIIEQKRPRIVSFYTRCDTYHIDLKMAERIKKHFDDIYIVFGGPQSDITAEDTLKNIPYVDYICCGEGENTIYPFFSSLLEGSPDLTIDGLVYKDGKTIKKNPRPTMLENLDLLPMIDYSISNCTIKNDLVSFPIQVGRGCPFNCIFCSTKTFWGRKFRLKSPQRIVDEIKIIYDKYGITRFNFSHDMFTFNRDKVLETCSLIKQLNLPITWSCSARVDCLDFELIDVMIDSGMDRIYMGIESGSPRMQKLINKRLKIENVENILGYLDSKNISIISSFIYGFPEENEEDIIKTMALIIKLLDMSHVQVQTHLCTFLPATELTEKYKEFLTPTTQSTDIVGDYAIKECSDLFNQYPEIFEQMFEYKTELRSKLKYFSIFFKVWKRNILVYKYLCEKYQENRLIDMYYDFVDANTALLEENADLSEKEIINLIEQNDKFPFKFNDDENFDIIFDVYRFKSLKYSKFLSEGETITEMYSFNPVHLQRCSSLHELKKQAHMVFVTKKAGKLSVVSIPK